MTVTQICDAKQIGSDSEPRLNEDILRTLMAAKGIKSVAELSRRTRENGSYVSKATIFRQIAGETGSSVRVGRAIAKVLDTTVETLFAEKRQA